MLVNFVYEATISASTCTNIPFVCRGMFDSAEVSLEFSTFQHFNAVTLKA